MLRTITILVALLLAMPLAAQEVPLDIDFCLAKGKSFVEGTDTQTEEWTAEYHDEQMALHAIECASVFYRLMDLENLQKPGEWPRRDYLDQRYEPLVMTLTVDRPAPTKEQYDLQNYELLQQIIDGDFDAELLQFAEVLATDGRTVYLQVLHEANSNWSPWGMFTSGNTPALYVEAFQHIYQLFQVTEATNVKFVINWNRKGPDGRFERYQEYFAPIDELVVAHSVSSYNRCGTDEDRTILRTFADDFAATYRRLIVLTDKPIWVAETATSGLCGEDLTIWYRDMLASLRDNYVCVTRVIFVFSDIPPETASNDVSFSWQAGELQAFRYLMRKWTAESAERASCGQTHDTPFRQDDPMRPIARPTSD